MRTVRVFQYIAQFQDNPLPRIVLLVGFEPRAVQPDIGGMRAAFTPAPEGANVG
jgi:hypothetical protein